MLYNNLSNTYIEEKLKFIPGFNGAIGKDELKNIKIDNKNGNYIVVNTDLSTGQGYLKFFKCKYS